MKTDFKRTAKRILAGSICAVMIGINCCMFIPTTSTNEVPQTAMVQNSDEGDAPSNEVETRIARLPEEIKVTSRGGYSRRNIVYTIYKFTSSEGSILYFNELEQAETYKTKVLDKTINLTINIEEIQQNTKENISTNEDIENITNNLISQYAKPVTFYPTISKYISSKYGNRSRGWHSGIDLAGNYGDSIYAYKSGKVISVQYSNKGYGNNIVIQHEDGSKTRYAHLSSAKVKTGQYVEGGQKIGCMGSTGNSTGNHLHFEVIINGKTVNPYSYLQKWL